MKSFILTTLVLIPFLVWSPRTRADLNLESSVVKITSTNPKSSGSLNGSGFLFKYRGLALVLTSEHILIPSNQEGSVVRMKTQAGESYSLQVLKSDWASGLALLRIEDTVPTDSLSDLKDLILLPPATTGAAISAGFPAASDGILLDPDGVLTNAQSHFELFLEVPYLIEVKSAMTEFGMSGGLLVSEDLKPLGILSHKSDTAADLTYVIPMTYALSWVQNTIDQSDFKPAITRMNTPSSPNTLVLNSGNFSLNWNTLPSNELSMYYLRVDEISMAKNFPHVMFEDAERICSAYFKMHFAYYPYVHLFGFRKKGVLKYDSDLIYPKSLLQTFKLLKDPSLQPVAYAWFGNGDRGENWETHQRLRQAMHDFMSNYYRRYEKLDLMPYLAVVRDVLDAPAPSVLDDGPSMLERLSPHDVDFILNDPSLQDSWRQMKNDNAKGTEQLLQNLRDLRKMVADYVL